MQRTFIATLVPVFVVFAFGGCRYPGQSAAGAAGGSQAAGNLASALCGAGAIPRLVAAYPQSQMSQEQQKAQTLGEGLERLKSFQEKLPGIVQPVTEVLRKERDSWSYLQDLSTRVNAEVKKRQWDPALKKEMEDFTGKTVAAMKAACPGDFQDAANERYSGFVTGAVIGAISRSGP